MGFGASRIVPLRWRCVGVGAAAWRCGGVACLLARRRRLAGVVLLWLAEPLTEPFILQRRTSSAPLQPRFVAEQHGLKIASAPVRH